MNAYKFDSKIVADKLKTNIYTGLSTNQALDRLKEYGPNELVERPPESFIKLFLKQFQSALIYVLLAAGLLKIIVGSLFEALLIFIILLINACIGAYLEGRAESILESLKKFIKTEAIVLRDGKRIIIDQKELVPGDILLLQEGSKIPADARLVAEHNLTVDEAALTGESQAVSKTIETLPEDKLPAHDQRNMVFTGTYVLSGNGKAIVTATADATEIGRLHKSISTITVETPLKKDIAWLSRIILITLFTMMTLFLGAGLLYGQTFSELLFALIALFVSAIPEGLPIIVTVVLARGAYQMALRNVLVKKLTAIETLGRVQVMIIDKTGTLTRNEMLISRIYTNTNGGQFYTISGVGYDPNGTISTNTKSVENFDEHKVLNLIGVAGILLNKAHITLDKKTKLYQIKGEPIQAALFVLSRKMLLDPHQVKQEYKLLYEIPFDPVNRLHIGYFKVNNHVRAFIFGSPEMVLQRCSAVPQDAQKALNSLLAEGLRLVALATKKYDASTIKPAQQLSEEELFNYYLTEAQDMSLVGLIGMQDAIRPSVDRVVADIQKAGFHIAMATGDHKDTALFVAKKTGLYTDGSEVMNGDEFEQISKKEFLEKLPKITVFSRVTPQEKMAIVQGFHELHKVVAMTGDGVNDVPPLVAADVGIAMGTIGTEITRQAADIVLLDDSLETIVEGIEWGRHIFLTIRRVTLYLLATNLAEILLIGSTIIMGLPLPLVTTQILWINLVTDGFLDIALTLEPKPSGLLFYKDFNKIKLLDGAFWLKVGFLALPMAIGSLGVFIYYINYNIALARTMTLVTLSAFQWFNAWNMRSEFSSLFSLNLLSNKWLVGGTVVVALLQITAVYIPALNKMLSTVPLHAWQWFICLALASTVLIFEELRKRFMRNA